MRFGLSPAQFQEVHSLIVKPLANLGARIWCFGSRARGDHQPFSDIDIMVDCGDDLSETIANIKERFEKSNFPFKLDLVQKKDFAENYIPGFERDKIAMDVES